jgi:predicted dehydrogenase
VALAAERSIGLNLVAVADSDAAKASALAARLQGPVAVMTPMDVTAAADIDAVLIVTDASSHFELASAALTAGKHAFVEKPLARTTVECTALIAQADRASRMLMVGHTFLYSDHVLGIEQALTGGRLGAIRYAHLERLAYGRFRDDVNVTWNLGTHDVSILMHWAGRPPLAVRCTEYLFTRARHSDLAHLALDFGNFLGHVQLSCVDPQKVRRATIAGTKAGIVYDDVAGEVQMIANDTASSLLISSPTIRRPLDVEIDHFATSILTGSQPRTNGVHGAAVVAVLETASESAASGGAWIDLPELTFISSGNVTPGALSPSPPRYPSIEDYRAD